MKDSEKVLYYETIMDVLHKHDLMMDYGYWWKDPELGYFIFCVLCNDTFDWGTGDAEEVYPEDLDLFVETIESMGNLEKALRETNAENPYVASDAPLLYCVRKREMRPQGAVYKSLNPHIIPIINSFGPEREIDFFNPYTESGEYKYKKDKGESPK